MEDIKDDQSIPFSLKCVLMNEFPPLAWVAALVETEKTVQLLHGCGVETGDSYACESVWDSPYDDYSFDRTDIVFGSGVRLRANGVTFVSSGSTVDRLVYCLHEGCYYISNSVVLLSVCTDAKIDEVYKKYHSDFRSIVKGLGRYVSTINGSRPEINLVYFNNLFYDGKDLKIVEKPNESRKFRSFEEYHEFLVTSATEFGKNLQSRTRSWRLKPLGTLSSGYDSTAVSVLSRLMGNEEVLTFTSARVGLSDDGTHVADLLGLRPIALDRYEWRKNPEAVTRFLSGDPYGEEVHFQAAAGLLGGRVLLTGYHGDIVWDIKPHETAVPLVRHDWSGMSLSEARLELGFIHCPIPFLGARSVEQIQKISASEEMKAWSVGGEYDRPICRRIVEEAGVPRHLFGIDKRAASVVLLDHNERFLPESLLTEFQFWLRQRTFKWIVSGEIPPIWKMKMHKGRELIWRTMGRKLEARADVDTLFYHLYPWVFEKEKQKYLKYVGLWKNTHAFKSWCSNQVSS